MRECPRCGTNNPTSARFCRRCGREMVGRTAAPPPLRHKRGFPFRLFILLAIIAFWLMAVPNWKNCRRIERTRSFEVDRPWKAPPTPPARRYFDVE